MIREERNKYDGTLREPTRTYCKITSAPENKKESNINSAPEKEESKKYAICMFFVLFVLSLMGLTNQSIAGIGLVMYLLRENLNGLASFGVTIAIAHLYFTRKMVDELMAIVCWIICMHLVYYFFPKKYKCCGKDDNCRNCDKCRWEDNKCWDNLMKNKEDK